MSCDGNCNDCPIQCGASKIITKVKEKLEGKESMSSAVGGCHAGNDEKIGRLDERSQFIVERNNSCKWIGVIALLIALGGLFVAWTALRDLDAVKDQLRNINSEIKRVDIKADDAKLEATRGYNYLRKNKRSL